MKKRRTNGERLRDVLDAMGIRTSIAGGAVAKDNPVSRSIRETSPAYLWLHDSNRCAGIRFGSKAAT